MGPKERRRFRKGNGARRGRIVISSLISIFFSAPSFSELSLRRGKPAGGARTIFVADTTECELFVITANSLQPNSLSK